MLQLNTNTSKKAWLIMKKNIISKFSIGLLVIFILTIFVGIIFLAFMGFFKLTDVIYESYTSLFLFVLLFIGISLILEGVSKLVIWASTPKVESKLSSFIRRMVIDSFCTWLALYTADEFMTSIHVPLHIEIIISVLLFLLEEIFDDRYKKKKK